MNSIKTKITMAFVGDVALGDHPKRPGFGFYSKYKKGIPPNIADMVFPSEISPDLVFGNLEFALTQNLNDERKEKCCLGSPFFVSFLKQAGFTVLNAANNHICQYGTRSFRDTIEFVRQEGIKVVGVSEDFDAINFIKIGEATIAFLGCSARPRQEFSDVPGYNEFDRDRFLQQIREAKQTSEFVCVSIHWGKEFIEIPSDWERSIAHDMVDAGACVVLGHHPHVLREIERYKDGLIAYSLGNFICDMTWNSLTRESGVLCVEFENSSIKTWNFRPAHIEDDFFPHYITSPLVAQSVLDLQTARQGTLKKDLTRCNYETLAKKALRRHQLLTIMFFLKNIFRYKLSTLMKIIRHAVSVRLKG